ncbi:hypothetical protein PHYBLDRAFT_146372 [Phycomyces blakesleeanus NRRL 1555(-)]|uniref:Uncharacterized protein n=1 Tax=Phycomyces blakesleeanus (strain ATCC 8743b / DSM 1359 / FGSC 10004 / NBRC 33097 / NRRL 1555) TaxID=763407 RepID=A0A163DRZ4_PHYB8|nr:hypothetical protein PHYBLDRAFT_146372 [Phycomyces blakesleeanus NRRL 1555(-)]OAD73060.1 hypothetical protein PHYBLDRAFT_146372 [Phycomyces blakesleeanus NRRL 1555(-)]|eukprot:XP_018291100.1 hypothetical protein PHYBLDRAFT_146372 [Phycomyces blakesleeanus NRRL 1555(-)]
MSHLPGVLFFWKDPERPIDMILLQSDQSKSFVLLSDSAVINTHSQQLYLIPTFEKQEDRFSALL